MTSQLFKSGDAVSNGLTSIAHLLMTERGRELKEEAALADVAVDQLEEVEAEEDHD